MLVAAVLLCRMTWPLPVQGADRDGRLKKAQTKSESLADDIYSTAQARRGANVYLSECVSCHGDMLTGGDGVPALEGQGFREKWKGSTTAALAERVCTTMPADSPGRLNRRQCADIVAYILNVNGVPAGSNELVPDGAAGKTIPF